MYCSRAKFLDALFKYIQKEDDVSSYYARILEALRFYLARESHEGYFSMMNLLGLIQSPDFLKYETLDLFDLRSGLWNEYNREISETRVAKFIEILIEKGYDVKKFKIFESEFICYPKIAICLFNHGYILNLGYCDMSDFFSEIIEKWREEDMKELGNVIKTRNAFGNVGVDSNIIGHIYSSMNRWPPNFYAIHNAEILMTFK